METRTVEQVESWSTRSVADGYAGLRELSDGEFSGAVRAGGAWLFMLNGRIIGIYEGSLDDFEDADGTAYAAPHPSLPLLFSMQEQGGETQAKYYTNDTPLSEVDSTLTDGKFTGFIELSENVLSGDYYVAYYGGRSMSVAFVGASEQVVTGEEAFERAGDEVGIYEVRDVSIEVTDVPEPDGADESSKAETSSPSGATNSTDAPGATGSGNVDPLGGGDAATSARDGRAASDSQVGQSATSESASNHSAPEQSSSDRSTANGGVDAPGQQDRATAGRSSASTEPQVGETTDGERTTDATGSRAVESTPSPESSRAETASEQGESEPESDSTASEDASATDGSPREPTAFSEEAKWRETTTIPSLDPDRSESLDAEADESDQSTAVTETDRRAKSGSASGDQSRSNQRSVERGQSRTESTAAADRPSDASGSPETTSSATTENASGTAETSSAVSEDAQARIQKLQSQLRQRKQQIEQLKQRLSTLESERDEFERERDALRQEVKRLEAKLDRAESAAPGDADRQLSETQAFDGTNLFVRYESKGKATLEEAAEGTVDAADVNANLRLEHHTQFDTEGVRVNGESFETFLTDSFEYRFVSWVIEELLYEIRETGHRDGLRELYSSIPKIDRVDLHGDVNAGDNDEDTRQESFDVIMRDRMGNPLIVADLNGSREPTTGDMMGTLVDAASGVGETYDELSAAFQITESFFEPEALETTEAATSGGFLSREKRESFVKLSRKRGYHLCLVESRSGGFHLNVPEL